jgi:hypothetical protein
VIRRLVLRRFKRFEAVELTFPGHVVLAGPNDSGKTTVLQAVAAWSLALARWKQLNDFQRHGGAYTRAPLARQAFSAVPLRAFDLLWHGRHYQGPVEIEIQTDAWTLGMELLADSTEQIHVRPKPAAPEIVRAASLNTVFVPAMSGLGTEEPVYQRPKIDQLLGQPSRATSSGTCSSKPTPRRRRGRVCGSRCGGCSGSTSGRRTRRAPTSSPSTARPAGRGTTSRARGAASSRS